ncbi:MAG TPA: four helix bundle protein, partial [Gemmatimonadales bacterium]|nr:four helix bundle protein [Gemmatimonadales bacterium]
MSVPHLLRYHDTVRDHKSMEAWQEANKVVREVLTLSRVHWKPHGGAIINQLQRASLSVQLNIAEGYAYGDSATYTKFLGIAYGSAVETLELLELAGGAGIFPKEPTTSLMRHAQSSRNLLLALLKRRRRF